jgi:1-pyrroline-5-carboxylate dehydrogenase
MSNSALSISAPGNEPVFSYAPGSAERERLMREMEHQAGMCLDIPLIIAGEEIRTGDTVEITMPHDHAHVLGRFHRAGEKEIGLAIEAALKARLRWEELAWVERASLALKAAQLISVKYRYILNSATMLGQSKNVYQAEIDATCELADFLRFNAHYLSTIYQNQPASTAEAVNRMEYRALEGFVLAITPFNFTAIAGNLCTAPALMGNTVVWKPASTAVYSGYYLMQLFKEAGFPDGVINFVPCSGALMGAVALKNSHLAGIHFTGSTAVFQQMWRTVGENIQTYHSYPRIVGETGGKDFIVAHASAEPDALCTALIRGAFEYQGQKCSAVSRAYIPGSLWPALRRKMLTALEEVSLGDPGDCKDFMNALIDRVAFDRVMNYIEQARHSDRAEIVFGGGGDATRGYFIQPTVIEVKDPNFVTMTEEVFGPVLSLYVYLDEQYEETLTLCDRTSPYALTGAVFAVDRRAVALAESKLRHAAGNFYINDKPTGAVVGQQPFGGSRASGTNDKAGSMLNLLRWTSARTIKENLAPPGDYRYAFMQPDDARR